MEFKRLKRLIGFAAVAAAFCLQSCSGTPDYSPKPRGYFRIVYPEKAYREYTGGCPIDFQYPVYAKVEPDSSRDAKPCWLNVQFPSFKATLHLTYAPVTSKAIFDELTEDTRKLAFKHTVKATAIDEGFIRYPEKKVYGIFYTIDGNAASSAQFFLTDSTKHYLRGALYFNSQPRLDSIQPVLNFVKKDLDVMIKTFRWKP